MSDGEKMSVQWGGVPSLESGPYWVVVRPTYALVYHPDDNTWIATVPRQWARRAYPDIDGDELVVVRTTSNYSFIMPLQRAVKEKRPPQHVDPLLRPAPRFHDYAPDHLHELLLGGVRVTRDQFDAVCSMVTDGRFRVVNWEALE